ncbi:MAG: dihydroorotate dehydrogenase electron transfer subunit [Clostridia bacterium]|nr:dihydroorotate dehydrogenase electron transfer subunit [Clostridia bacterium]
MKQSIFEIVSHEQLTETVFRMVLAGDTSDITATGQFVNVRLEGKFLRRPISVCDWDDQTLTLVYKVVGLGTEQMSKMLPGEKLDILTGLGNGYNLEAGFEKPLLIGGGVGVPPLFALCKALCKKGVKPVAILGFNKKEEIFLKEDFEKLGVEVIVATADGSYGVKGFVTDAMKTVEGYDYFFSCGPEPMLKAVSFATECSGQLSFEERMACGFGACMGCSCKTKYGNKRICKDGPVLTKEEVIW